MREFTESALEETLREAQRIGFLGDRPITEVIAHARLVVEALDGVSGRVMDLGSGGGVPGLVVAHDRPDLEVVLVDRRTKRTDHLRRVVRRYGLDSRVDVVSRDAEAVARDVERGRMRPVAAAMARGFGPPEVTLSFLRRMVRATGRVIVTEPPTGDRWDPVLLRELGLRREDEGNGVAVFHVEPS